MSIRVVYFDIGNTLVSDKKWLPGAKKAVADLAANKIRIGLISNTGQLTREELSEGFLPADFDLESFEQGIVFLSSEVGVEKPDHSIFALAVQHSGVSPWETMFIGECPIETVAAQSAGMRSARIVNSEAEYPKLVKLIIA